MRQVKNLKSNETIFTTSRSKEYLSETPKGVRSTDEYSTYKVESKRNKYVVYRLERRKKPRRIKTFNKTRNLTKEKVIENIRSGKYKLKQKHTESMTKYNSNNRKIKTIYETQQNYRSKYKNRSEYLQGLVYVEDTRRNISDTFLVQSRNYNQHYKNQLEAQNDLIEYALARFYSDYGHPLKSSDMYVEILDTRWKYVKQKIF